jgi:hypothetical protein
MAAEQMGCEKARQKKSQIPPQSRSGGMQDKIDQTHGAARVPPY